MIFRVIIVNMVDQAPRLINPNPLPEDHQDLTIRPKALSDLIGQEKVKDNLAILIAAARQRNESLDHVLFYGPPGLGKTTLELYGFSDLLRRAGVED